MKLLYNLEMVKSVNVDGVQTNYKQMHPKKNMTIVILHGLRGDHQALLELGRVLKDFNVIIPDLPGHGRSEKLCVHSIKEYAKWLNGFLGSLNLKNVIVIGHSIGANIAMAAIPADKGKRIGKAIHFVMYPKYHNTGINKGVKSLYKFGKLFPTSVVDRVLRTRLMSLLTIRTMVSTKDKQLARWIVDDGHRAAQMVNSRVIEDVFEDMAGVDMRNYLDNSVPQLFIITSEDKFSHNAEIKQISRSLNNSELIELDELGHLAPLEDPERLVSSIAHWLS